MRRKVLGRLKALTQEQIETARQLNQNDIPSIQVNSKTDSDHIITDLCAYYKAQDKARNGGRKPVLGNHKVVKA